MQFHYIKIKRWRSLSPPRQTTAKMVLIVLQGVVFQWMEENEWRRKNANAFASTKWERERRREHSLSFCKIHAEKERDGEKNNNVKLVWCLFLIVAMIVMIFPAIFRVAHWNPSQAAIKPARVMCGWEQKWRTHRHFPTSCTTEYTQVHFISKSKRHFPNAIHALETISRVHSHGNAFMSI